MKNAPWPGHSVIEKTFGLLDEIKNGIKMIMDQVGWD